MSLCACGIWSCPVPTWRESSRHSSVQCQHPRRALDTLFFGKREIPHNHGGYDCDASDLGVTSSSFLSTFIGWSDTPSGDGCFTEVVSWGWFCSTLGLTTCGGLVDSSKPSPEWRVAGATVPCCRTLSAHSRSVALPNPPCISPGPSVSVCVLSPVSGCLVAVSSASWKSESLPSSNLPDSWGSTGAIPMTLSYSCGDVPEADLGVVGADLWRFASFFSSSGLGPWMSISSIQVIQEPWQRKLLHRGCACRTLMPASPPLRVILAMICHVYMNKVHSAELSRL